MNSSIPLLIWVSLLGPLVFCKLHRDFQSFFIFTDYRDTTEFQNTYSNATCVNFLKLSVYTIILSMNNDSCSLSLAKLFHFLMCVLL